MALDTIFVAFPGVFGVVADRLSIQDVLGFTSNVFVLRAVAREHGVYDRGQQVRMLAEVMCGRVLPADLADADDGSEPPRSESANIDRTPRRRQGS